MTEAEPASETFCRYFYKRLCLCAIVCLCVFILVFWPPLRVWSVSNCVTNCNLGFSLSSSVSLCMWVCVCLGLYAILVFPKF
jgi:hypothetical protein